MFGFDKNDVQRFAVSAVGALAVSSALLIGAAGPARAASPAPANAAEWTRNVERQISSSDENLSIIDGSTKVHKVTLRARFTADGDYAGAQVAESSGRKGIDARAVKIASAIAYPLLPAAYRGEPQTVMMRLFFGNDSQQVARAAAREPVLLAFDSDAGAGRLAR